MKASDISAGLFQKPTDWHDAGTDRVSKNGRKLGGTYDESLWSLNLTGEEKIDAEDTIFEEFIASKNLEFSKHKGFLKAVIETGGSIEYFVGWFSEGSINMNIILEPYLMKATSELGIAIVLCAYPEN
jgi:hypothetical protein